jgi:hypothetical protein
MHVTILRDLKSYDFQLSWDGRPSFLDLPFSLEIFKMAIVAMVTNQMLKYKKRF